MGVQGVDLTGQKFGKLRVIEKVKIGYGKYKWRCVCDCGKEHFVRTYHLVHGNVKSCGCEHFKACVTHGMTYSRLYYIWSAMKARCSNPKTENYPRYGGRGISVCNEWRQFERFRDWAYSNGYTDELTIDRIDNDRDYCPGNCRWVPMSEQAKNTRANRIIEYKGEKKILSDMARRYGLKPSVVSHRLSRGWSIGEALEMPLLKGKTRQSLTMTGSSGR